MTVTPPPASPSHHALDAAIAEFLADCRLRSLSPKTIEWYKYALEPFARFALAQGERDVAAVTEHTVRGFLAKESAEVQPRRVDHYRQAIDRFYKWLIAEGRLQRNPAAPLQKIREPRRLIGTFDEKELGALLAQPDLQTFLGLRDHVFMLLLLDTGVRLSEALGVRLSDLDLETDTIRVLGKGNKERLVGFSPVMGTTYGGTWCGARWRLRRSAEKTACGCSQTSSVTAAGQKGFRCA
jgi:site-specific recombinase XerD